MSIQRSLQNYFRPNAGTVWSRRLKKASYVSIVIPVLVGIALGFATAANSIGHKMSDLTGSRSKSKEVFSKQVKKRIENYYEQGQQLIIPTEERRLEGFPEEIVENEGKITINLQSYAIQPIYDSTGPQTIIRLGKEGGEKHIITFYNDRITFKSRVEH